MLIRADARSIPLRDGCVQCVVTSPPYYNLRDYGHAGQIGNEDTWQAYVGELLGVFAELRRVLADDGVVWLNLGDSYAAGGKGGGGSFMADRREAAWQKRSTLNGFRTEPGFKQKDLLGIPWRVAFALQQPYYTGAIASERDRVWLASAIDAEGCIFIHKRKAGQSNGQGYERQNDSYGSGLEVANTSEAYVQRCLEIVGKGSICHQDGFGRKQRIYRWNLRSNECRGVLSEVYPFLVAKQQQARLAIGCPSSGREAEAAHAALKGLHNGFETSVDFKAPAPMFTQGWYLRSDVIWSKANPMPESVTDRPTKSHEYLFLLTKSSSYYYDAAAIAEAASYSMVEEVAQGYSGLGIKDYEAHGVQNPSTVKARIIAGARKRSGTYQQDSGRNDGGTHLSGGFPTLLTRNKRTVWTIPTMPYAGAHFATMPEALVEPCILAGSRLGDLILDPFVGSGTTLKVAAQLGRRGVGLDLNPQYLVLARRRSAQIGLFVNQRAAAPHIPADAPADAVTDPATQDSSARHSAYRDLYGESDDMEAQVRE